jgi:hypothetical protein
VATGPAVVSPEGLARVQAKLALNKQQATRNNQTPPSLLGASVSCGACPSACVARTPPRGHSDYLCRCSVQPLYSQHAQRCRAR